jgi:[protein-PII] uridylyltransferase
VRPELAEAEESLKARVAGRRAELERRWIGGDSDRTGDWGIALARDLARLYDDLLASVFATLDGGTVCLAAVGGYGRGMLALRSDLDLRFLARTQAEAESISESVLYPLWDAGLSVGHQTLVLSDVVDLAREDLATATSMLDWRFLAGDRALSDELVWRVSGSLFSTSELERWGKRLAQEVERRHERFGDSVYLLEPDVKNGAGGLRDLDVFRWTAAARFGGGEVAALVRVGALVPREAKEVGEAQERLWAIRHLLHAHAGRRSDRLTFDEQEEITRYLGIGDGGDAVERFMSDYYRGARAVTRAVSSMFTRATAVSQRRPKDEDLGGGFRSFDGEVTVADTSVLEREPHLCLRLVQVAVEHDKPLYAFAREAVMRLTSDQAFCERLRNDRESARCFVDLVCVRKETRLVKGSPLREMHELGLLLAMIPEFLPVVGRVHHDVYHVYTVDVHSVAAVDRLAALTRGQLTTEHPLASRLAAEVVDDSRSSGNRGGYATLAFATLLHDVGKAIGRKDHSLRGAELCPKILGRLGFSELEIACAAHLVREHLTMYRLATARDVDDDATIREMAAAVTDCDTLRSLFLLTVVDVATTSPTSMTSWKAHMLDELFIATDGVLSGEAGETGRAERLRGEIVSFAEGYLEGEPLREEELAFLPSYLASMPDRYLASSSAHAVVAHASTVRRYVAPLAVEVVPSSHPEAVELCIVAHDRPGLLAMIAAALASSNLDVLAAQIHSRKDEGGSIMAVDLFWVLGRFEGAAAVGRALDRVRRDLARLLAGEAPENVLRRRPPARRAGPEVKTRVAIDHRASANQSIIEVSTHDRPGLLFAIANVFFELGLSIRVAKINTEGTRVADVFYVTEADGTKVAPGPRSAEIEGALVAALHADDPGGAAGAGAPSTPPTQAAGDFRFKA